MVLLGSPQIAAELEKSEKPVRTSSCKESVLEELLQTLILDLHPITGIRRQDIFLAPLNHKM